MSAASIEDGALILRLPDIHQRVRSIGVRIADGPIILSVEISAAEEADIMAALNARGGYYDF